MKEDLHQVDRMLSEANGHPYLNYNKDPNKRGVVSDIGHTPTETTVASKKKYN